MWANFYLLERDLVNCQGFFLPILKLITQPQWLVIKVIFKGG